MEIRPATEDDIGAIRRVAEASWETDYPDVLSRETIRDGVDQWYSEPVIMMELQSPRTELLVGEVDGELVGFVHGHWAGNAGIILRLYVHPAHRSEGLGSELFEAAAAALRDHGVEQLRAMALEANETATAFYEGLGMVQVDAETTAIAGDQYREAVYEFTGG
jgi:ribosomal protein S18 acetylase RimI-like enzyme